MPRDVPLLRARWLGLALVVSCAVPCLAGPLRCTDTPAALALALAALATIALFRGRVWGLYASLAVAGVLAGARPNPSWLATAGVALVVFAVHLPALLRRDRLAALLLAGLVAAGAPAAGWLAAWCAIPAPAVPPEPGHAHPTAALRPHAAVAPVGAERALEVTAELVTEPRAARVTFRNASADPLDVDLPIVPERVPTLYPPLLDPLIQIRAFDARGQRLNSITQWGCGAVYSHPKVERVRLAPGEARTFLFELPDAWYPQTAVLPQYATAMLMNAEELVQAPRAQAVPRVRLVVRYDTAALRGSWRDDLRTSASRGVRIHGQSESFVAASLPNDTMMPTDWSAVAAWARADAASRADP